MIAVEGRQRLRSQVDTGSEQFQAARQEMLDLLAVIEEQLALARAGGGERAITRHRERGKLLIRERVELLLDRDAPFLELSPLAGWGTDFPVGGGFVSGLGVVSGTECVIVGHDPTVMGGAITAISNKKIDRALEIARLNRLPFVQFVESAGGDLRRTSDDPEAEMRRNLTHFAESGRLFHDITQLSALRIPAVSVVFGSSTAGGAYQPGLGDYNIFVRGRSKVFLGGPPLVKMATGEDSNDEELGGAEMHATISGLADYLADDEVEALRMAREVIAHLNWRKLGPGPSLPADPPAYDPEALLGLMPVDLKTPVDVREVIARIVDGSRFEEFKPFYGRTLVTGWASIHGFPVGIIGNNGVLFSDSSDKAAHFIQLCNQVDVPIVFLQNITGYMVGKVYEHGGIVKNGSKMINAVSNSTVPHLTVILGASYGAGNYGMGGKAFDTRFVFAWPTAKISIMGPTQIAGVMQIVRRGAAAAQGRTLDPEEDERLFRQAEDRAEKESLALYATGRVADDGVIDPRDTRTVLGITLSAVHSNEVQGARGFGVFRM
ncbi:MAG TPA: carboxyl transferase domain-containing protein [Tepidiformaceae bacterium]|nr:carboxyl transferase domain-containing protein [Tepidiformaceae bacterium]